MPDTSATAQSAFARLELLQQGRNLGRLPQPVPQLPQIPCAVMAKCRGESRQRETNFWS
jgi:hypothetical protein